MKKTNGEKQQQGEPTAETGTFDWEVLPDLAKDRWEEAVAYDLTMETQLAKAQSNRSQAEVERQRVAGEILEATREVCHEIASDSRKALESARYMEIDAAHKVNMLAAQLANTAASAGVPVDQVVRDYKAVLEALITPPTVERPAPSG